MSSGQLSSQAALRGVWTSVIGLRMLWKESMKYWCSSFKILISLWRVRKWDKSQYNEIPPAVSSKKKWDWWKIFASIIETNSDVIIKYFIFIFCWGHLDCIPLFLFSEGGWENAQRVWFRALLNSNSLISKLFVLWRSILRKRVPYADLNPYVLNHSLRNIYFLQVTIINRSFFLNI